jgi:CCR4-NOT transcription complex subunit 6
MVSRSFVTSKSATAARSAASATLVTYNILADGERLAMSSKHDYCSRELREWGDRKSGRCARLISELQEYNADVFCLQECNAKAFLQFETGLGGPSAEGRLQDGALASFHASSLLTGKEAEDARQSTTGLATFIRQSTWEPVAAHAVRLGSLLEDHRHTGAVRKKLSSQSEAVLLVLLQHGVTKQRLVVGNTHLFWDPRYPHIKAAQAELACKAACTFIRKHAVEGEPLPAMVLMGDFNSIPQLQPAFLPISIKLPAALPARWSHSATYELMTAGRCESTHPEHPDTFLGKISADRSSEPPVAKKPNGASGLGALRTGLSLRDGYAGALVDGPLPLTTHADNFKGGIDYIWVSTFPPTPAAATGMGSTSMGSVLTESVISEGVLPCSPVEIHEVLGMPYAVDQFDAFEKIPSESHASDHLALGLKLSLPPPRPSSG